jgi:creatinine amidohydrolase
MSLVLVDALHPAAPTVSASMGFSTGCPEGVEFMVQRKAWRLEELSLKEVQENPPEVAVLPFGATEPHGMHMPYGTDIFESVHVADRACELATERGARVVTLPTIPFGCQTNQRGFPLAMNLYPSTLNRIIDDLIETLDYSGVKKAVILNGHGGNDFYPHLRERHGKCDVHVSQVNWFALCPELQQELFPAGGDHANDMETSLIMHLRAELVALEDAGPQGSPQSRIAAFNEGWARAPRDWKVYTEDSGVGDPRAATAEKGRRYFEAITETFAGFLVELSETPKDERFPY